MSSRCNAQTDMSPVTDARCQAASESDHCHARPAAVIPIKLERSKCETLKMCLQRYSACEGGCPPAKGANPFEPGERERRTLDDTLPTTVWDRIFFYGTVCIASACTVAMVFGSMGWAYTRWIA